MPDVPRYRRPAAKGKVPDQESTGLKKRPDSADVLLSGLYLFGLNIFDPLRRGLDCYHSATLPSSWRQTGLRQRWPSLARSIT